MSGQMAWLEDSKATLLVLRGACPNGQHVVLAAKSGPLESKDFWGAALRELCARGLKPWRGTVSDAHHSVQAAAGLRRPVARQADVDLDVLAEELARLEGVARVHSDAPTHEILEAEGVCGPPRRRRRASPTRSGTIPGRLSSGPLPTARGRGPSRGAAVVGAHVAPVPHVDPQDPAPVRGVTPQTAAPHAAAQRRRPRPRRPRRTSRSDRPAGRRARVCTWPIGRGAATSLRPSSSTPAARPTPRCAASRAPASPCWGRRSAMSRRCWPGKRRADGCCCCCRMASPTTPMSTKASTASRIPVRPPSKRACKGSISFA
jgi:hypothetical protein